MSFSSIQDISSNRDPVQLAEALTTLFEYSPLTSTRLVPELLALEHFHPISYSELIDTTVSIISTWPSTLQAEFIAAHPRIGEVSNLSALSAAEQASKRTPLEILERLAYLNSEYERRYPGLVYITFVNGRSRAEIASEMEEKLGLNAGETRHPLDSGAIVVENSPVWQQEALRAVADVGRIAQNRLKALGVAGS